MKRAILLTSGSQIIIQLLGVLTGVLLARWLGPTGRGELAAVITWVSLFAYLGNLGFPVALTYTAANQKEPPCQLFKQSIFMVTIKWIVLGAAGYFLLPLALSDQSPSLTHLATVYLWAYLPLNLMTLNLNAIQQGLRQYTRYNAVRLTVIVSYSLLLIVLWGINHIDVESVIFINVLSNSLAFILALLLFIPSLLKMQIFSQPVLNSQSLAEKLRYGFSSLIGDLRPFSGLQIDVLALTMLSTSHETGLYMVAIAGANLLKAQALALGQVVFPEVAKKSTRQEQWFIIRRFMIIAGVGGCVALFIILFLAESLIRLLFGDSFTPATQMLQILVGAGSITSVYYIFADGMRGMGLPGLTTYAELAGLCIGGVLLIIFVPLYGGSGAALAALAASVTSLLVILWLARKKISLLQ